MRQGQQMLKITTPVLKVTQEKVCLMPGRHGIYSIPQSCHAVYIGQTSRRDSKWTSREGGRGRRSLVMVGFPMSARNLAGQLGRKGRSGR